MLHGIFLDQTPRSGFRGSDPTQYDTSAIITCGFYFFNTPLFEGARQSVLYRVYVSTKIGNSTMFRSTICGAYLREVSNQEWVILTQVQLVYGSFS